MSGLYRSLLVRKPVPDNVVSRWAMGRLVSEMSRLRHDADVVKHISGQNYETGGCENTVSILGYGVAGEIEPIMSWTHTRNEDNDKFNSTSLQWPTRILTKLAGQSEPWVVMTVARGCENMTENMGK